MLRVTLAAALLCLAAGQTSQYGPAPAPPAGGYGQPYGGYGPDPLFTEVNYLIGNVSVLNTNDASIDARIRALTAQNDANSILTERFNNEILPGFRKAQAAQDAEIYDLENQAHTILAVADDITVIANTLDEINEQLQEINDVNANEIQPAISALQQEDQEQDNTLDGIDTTIAEQEAKIEELVQRSSSVRERIGKIRETLHQVFDVLNSEDAETIEFSLTPDEPSITKCLSADFDGRVPNYLYGFTAIHVSDHSSSYTITPPPTYGGYGGYGPAVTPVVDNPNINWDVDVEYDAGTNKATARMYDLSDGGWVVEKLTIRAVFFRIDNRVISTYAA